MKRWESISYQTITNAFAENGSLTVSFQNGDEVVLPLKSLIPTVDEQEVRNIMSTDINYTSYEIILDVESGVKAIPWDKIRVVTDREFGRFMAEKADEQAKLIGVKIKRLREKKGIKSFELADTSGISAQTISRIEKGHQDIGFSTLRRLLAAMGYTLKDLANEEIELEKESRIIKTFPTLLKRLSKAGIDPQFVSKKLIPAQIQSAINEFNEGQPDLLLDEAASYLSNIYGWSLKDIWSNSELTLDESLIEETLFKKSVKSNYNQIKAYIPYAYYLAKIAIKAVRKRPHLPFPNSVEEFKTTLETKYSGINLKSILEYAWEMGVCILPLDDSGIFHGAAWKIDDGYAIVVKQKNDSHGKWIFDVLHELFHVFSHLDEANESIIETSEISPISKLEDIKEKEANSFANQAIFGDNAEEIAQEVVAHAKGRVEFLQKSVIEIAKRRNLRVDSLANYMAYRLSFQGKSWWGAAESLQELEPKPFEITKDIFFRNVNMNALEPIDYNLLTTALK